MADSAISVFTAAEDLLRQQNYSAALAGYLRVVQGVPHFWRARLRVADCLLNLKAREAALEVYKAIAWQAFNSGQPLSGLVAIKMATALDPHLREEVRKLASLYCHTSSRVDTALEPVPRRQLFPKDEASPAMELPTEALITAATTFAQDTSGMPPEASRLPPIPLFSFLDEDAFIAVLATLQLRRFVKDNLLIEEGKEGDSFFVLAEGSVDVTRQSAGKTLNLAKLPAGSVFGEMALVSQAPRTATVRALEDCDALELKRTALEHQKLKSVAAALRSFTQDRFLSNLTATSPVFKPFPRSMRIEIVRKFRDVHVKLGDELISEGKLGEGLYLVMKGQVEVTKKDGDERVLLARLKEGEVFGEISLIEDSPTTATVTAAEVGELLFLPKKEFSSTMARHPEFKHELKKLTMERIARTQEMMDSEVIELAEEDDLIML